MTPLLSNVYLHYVLDLWFQRRAKQQSQGEAYLFRYADDFLACFQYEKDAKAFRQSMEERLKKFHLELAEEKTKTFSFGRFARATAQKNGGKSKEFIFLGFTFYCGKTRLGHFKVKRRTSRNKLKLSLQKFTDWVSHKSRFPETNGKVLRRAKKTVMGTLNYYLSLTMPLSVMNIFIGSLAYYSNG